MNVLDAPESITMFAELEEDTELRAWTFVDSRVLEEAYEAA